MRNAGGVLQTACVLAAWSVSLAVAWSASDWARRLSDSVHDQFVAFSATLGDERRLAIVDVDESSLESIGAWPWPRERLADMLAQLREHYDVATVALDMVFPEAKEGDSRLAAELRHDHVVGAAVFEQDARRTLGVLSAPAWPVALPTGLAIPLPLASSYLTNNVDLPVDRIGHINPVIDHDGRVRRVQALVCYDGPSCYPNLALAAYLNLTGATQLALRPGEGALAPAYWLDVKEAGGTVITRVPLAADLTFRVPYRHRREAWLSVPAADVIAGTAPVVLLQGMPVLFGGTAFGLADVIATPLARVASGIEPHAEILSALLDGGRMIAYPPRQADAMVALWLAAWAGLLLLATLSQRGAMGRVLVPLVWLVLFMTASVVAGAVAHSRASWWLPAAPVLLFGPLAFVLSASAGLYKAVRQREGLFAHFSAYLPARQVQRLQTQSSVSSDIDAHRRDITVMFVDIHGFARLSQSMPAEEVAELLQRFFSDLADCVEHHGGVVDKYIGDAMMALWNAVDDDPAHARRAIDAARAIVARMQDFGPGPWGSEGLRIGVGIERGMALVGHFGPARRRTFTALGDAVVLASRYEEMSRTLGHAIVIGPAAAAGLEAGLLGLGEHAVRGHEGNVALYTAEARA